MAVASMRTAERLSKERRLSACLAARESRSIVPTDHGGGMRLQRPALLLLLLLLLAALTTAEHLSGVLVVPGAFSRAECKKVCHNMDEGLVEDPDNVRNVCGGCAKPGRAKGKQAAA